MINVRVTNSAAPGGLYKDAELVDRGGGSKAIVYKGRDLVRWNEVAPPVPTIRPRQFWWMGPEYDQYVLKMPPYVERTIAYDTGPVNAARNAGRFPRSWVYKDAYAIYNPYHPDHKDRWAEFDRNQRFILTVNGKYKFIDWGTPSGTPNGPYPQYAADIRNPEWRKQWIEEVRPLANLYGGVFMDDCNFTPQTVGASGVADQDWADAMGLFVGEIKAALPNVELLINTWYFRAGGLTNPAVRSGLAQADGAFLEFGFADQGLQPGGGQYGFDTLMAWCDFCHRNGTFVAVANAGQGDHLYHRACYMLIMAEGDYFTADTKDELLPLWGSPVGPAKKLSDSIWIRKFEKGNLTVLDSNRTWSFGP